jgi:hypothetical protein
METEQIFSIRVDTKVIDTYPAESAKHVATPKKNVENTTMSDIEADVYRSDKVL